MRSALFEVQAEGQQRLFFGLFAQDDAATSAAPSFLAEFSPTAVPLAWP